MAGLFSSFFQWLARYVLYVLRFLASSDIDSFFFSRAAEIAIVGLQVIRPHPSLWLCLWCHRLLEKPRS